MMYKNAEDSQYDNTENGSSKRGMMRTWGLFVGGVALGAVITAGIFLGQQKDGASANFEDYSSKPLFKIDGKIYTTATLPKDAAMEYYGLRSNSYKEKVFFSKITALRIALSSEKSKNQKNLPSIDKLISYEKVSENDAKKFYDQAQKAGRVPPGTQFNRIKAELITQLSQKNLRNAIDAKISQLESGRRLQVLLKAPVAPAVQLNIGSYPFKGNVNAANTFVEVADYMCPHCRESEPMIQDLQKKFAKKVKFVHVSYPLAPAGLSGALARGAFCAQKQGNALFWKYHTEAFDVPWNRNTPTSGVDPVGYFNGVATDVATKAGLNKKQFSECLNSKPAQDYIQTVRKDFNEGTGFHGTPAFYLNNRLLDVAPDQLSGILDKATKSSSDSQH